MQNHDEHVEALMNRLAESELELSDSEIAAEVGESERDPRAEATRTLATLRQASEAWEAINSRLLAMGHSGNSNHWSRSHHFKCRDCGSSVSFSPTTGDAHGDAFEEPCRKSDLYAYRRLKA